MTKGFLRMLMSKMIIQQAPKCTFGGMASQVRLTELCNKRKANKK